MPKRTDIHSILIIGSGPIVIGQACEFDYSGTQACRVLREEGYRMALVTNNVREWEPVWRPMLPVDEIFETVVDSGFVGCRKPEARIYELTLERLGLPGEACLFVDDLLPNIEGARRAGMQAVHFRDNEQAIAEIRGYLGDRPG